MVAEELKFLVIEDDDFQREIIVDILGRLGAMKVTEARTGTEALNYLNDEKPNSIDIILCDLNMPEMDGMEFLRHIGNSHSSIATIIMSALDGALIDSVRKMASAYGTYLLGAIEKPITPANLETLFSLFKSRDVKQRKELNQGSLFTLGEILEGLTNGDFVPFFQPKIQLSSGRLIGAEALARWVHPERGVIAPYAFIDLLEKSGNIDILTFIMLEESAKACKLIHAQGHKISISVNLSLTSLADTKLADKITRVVSESGLDPKYIILEITETAAMTEMAPALENLARLRMKGFGLSIDDYGTGYSSMQQIARIAFTELKIDQSFVREMTTSNVSKVLINSSIEMATRLQIKCTAEGIETKNDLEQLKGMNCDLGQGYYIAKPMSFENFLKFCNQSLSN
ncbi:EAL domain-containing protein [Leptospira kanakyensis]|uniref:EAL domain-containing protein n=2 Tax=Leptospira kanakyensis TaxID=2484968 RepID=A0A6N4QL27_9LEPT|nr:EAL domain-containing response regulator [Leptospira kanakyensis]TGK55561.1 EAL domain-containing protein [Leptospira kanakyensis]TGK61097.1 EAL domain-containing protein [Leptospira kanakyensis]TGK76431.1 EAL domain-containing protein [Leptospira kanakyensis]